MHKHLGDIDEGFIQLHNLQAKDKFNSYFFKNYHQTESNNKAKALYLFVILCSICNPG